MYLTTKTSEIASQLRCSADVQGHVIAVNDALHKTHPLGDEVVELFDEHPAFTAGIVLTPSNLFVLLDDGSKSRSQVKCPAGLRTYSRMLNRCDILPMSNMSWHHAGKRLKRSVTVSLELDAWMGCCSSFRHLRCFKTILRHHCTGFKNCTEAGSQSRRISFGAVVGQYRRALKSTSAAISDVLRSEIRKPFTHLHDWSDSMQKAWPLCMTCFTAR